MTDAESKVPAVEPRGPLSDGERAQLACLVPRDGLEGISSHEKTLCDCRVLSLDDALRAALKERDEARERAEKAEQAASDLATKHGGKNAGQIYGPANCSACKVLSNDYFLLGKGQLCMECWGAFPGVISERDALRAKLEGK